MQKLNISQAKRLLRKKVFGILLALFVGMIILSFKSQPVKSEPRTWIVDDDGPADFHTIQEAINYSADGDIVYVKMGNYFEHIVLRKPLKLLGENKYNTFIYTEGQQTYWGLIEVRQTNNVTISGFTIKGHENGMGIFMEECSNCNISHNIISNNQFGIDMRDSESNFIIDNEIFGCEVYGLVISGGSWNVLRGNNLTGNDLNLGVFGSYIHDIDTSNMVDGKPVYYWVNQEDKIVPSDAGYVALINSKDIIVKNLSITHNQGILLVNTTNSKIQDLSISESLRGIHFISCSNNLITGCTLMRNSEGIRMDNSCQNNVTGNTISYNWNDGIALYTSNENIIWNNTITIDWLYSDSFLIDAAYRNIIYHNNIIHRYNRRVFILTYGSNSWDNGLEGNYWSDYNGTDSDGNGIGDAPYTINFNNVDGYPLVNMLPNTPDTIPPVANAGNDKAEAVNVSVHFDASNSYDNVRIVSYEWDFGDGNTGTGMSINHTYSSVGNYTVTLTVRDAKNNIDSKSIIVQVLTDTDRDRIADRFDDDDDNDGLPDEWEIENGLNPLDSSDANQDLDGDWFTNIEEYRWGMNPRIFNPWKIYFTATTTVSVIAISVAIIITLNLLRKRKKNVDMLGEMRKT